MANLYDHRDANVRRTWGIFTVFFIVVIGVGWVLSYVYNAPEILLIAVAYSTISSITSYWFSDKIVLATVRAHPVTREEYFDLYNAVENLSITAGLPMPRVYVVDDAAPNAFATGRNEHHAVIAVTTGLLKVLDKTELEGVLAHELSHIGNKDILVNTVAVVLVGFVALVSDIFLRSLWHRGGDREKGGIFIVVGIALAILSPFIAQLMQLAISRKREFLADASGALLTRYPEGLARALEKISANDRVMKVTNNATNHLWMDDPARVEGAAGQSHWFAKLFATHPAIVDRVNALRETEKSQ